MEEESGPILPGCSCLPLGKKLFLGMPARSFPGQGSAYVHQCGVDVVAGFSIHRDEEGQTAVQRQDVHAPILIMVPGQQSDAAVLRPDARSHDVEGLRGAKADRQAWLRQSPLNKLSLTSLHRSSRPTLQTLSQNCSRPW